MMRPPDPENGNAPLCDQRGVERTIEKPCTDHSAKPRPFIHRFRSGVLRTSMPSPLKIVLLVLAEFADAEGGSCYPSLTSISRLSGLNEKTVRRHLEKSCAWFERTGHSGAGHQWRTYGYRLLIPEGADTAPARWLGPIAQGADSVSAAFPQGEGTESTASTATCGHSDSNVRTLSPERADTESNDIGFEIGKSILGENAPADAVASPGGSITKEKKPKRRQKKSVQTFDEWIASFPEDQDAIAKDHAVFRYAEKAGIPHEFLLLAWDEFCERYEGATKTYADWPKTFYNAVRGNWYKLWAPGESGYFLTTVGQQARIANGTAKANSGGYTPLPGEF
jgi:hypothetical protein